MSDPPRPRTSRWYHDPFVRWTNGVFSFRECRRTMALETRELPKAYVPADFEAGIYERWLAADVFAPDGKGSRADESKPPFVIIQPPPNITGSLHLGHAQRTSVEDLLIRHARMQGRPALFLPGLDHASIAAQYVLDKIIADGGGVARVARARALPRADVAVHQRDARGHARPAAAARSVGGLVAPPVHDGRGVREGRARRVRAAVSRRPGLSNRGAHQLVPRLPDERVRPGDDPDAGDRHALDAALPPDRRGDRGAEPGRDDQHRHHAAGDAPRRHGRGGPSG